MDFINILILSSAVINLSLGVFVFWKNKDRIANRSFFLMNLGIFCWSIAMIFYRASLTVDSSILWCKILYSAPCLVVGCFVYFTKSFPGNYVGKLTRIIVWIICLFFILLSLFTNYIVLDVVFHAGTEKEIIFGKLYYLFYPYFISGFFTWGYVVLLRKIFKNSGLLRVQLKYIFWGTFLASFISMLTNLTLPTFGIFDLNWAGQISTIIMVSFIAYAITRYRFMDIKVVYSNIFIYFLLIVFSESIFYLSAWVQTRFLGTIWDIRAMISGFFIALIFAFIFIRLLKYSEYWSDQLFYRGYNPRRLAKDFVIKASQTLNIDKLSDNLISEIKKALSVERVGIVLFLPKDVKSKLAALQIGAKDLENKIKEEIGNASLDSYKVLGRHADYEQREGEAAAYSRSKNINLNKDATGDASAVDNSELSYFGDSLIDKLQTKERNLILSQIKKDKVLISAENATKAQNRVTSIFLSNEILLVIPLVSRNQAIGAVFIGRDSGSESLSMEDVEFLSFLSSQIAASIANAYLAENMEEIIEAQTGDLKKKSEHMTKLLAMRSEFLDVASHQLRTPISVIKGMSSMFYDGSVKPENSKQFIEGIFVKSMKLADIIDDILKANEIETEGEYAIALSPTEVKPILEKVIKEKSFEANEKKIKLELGSVKVDLPKVLSEDEALTRVIKTLVSNALIYTKEGSVKLSAIKEGDRVIIRVADTGIGIPKEDIPKLFHKFARAKNATHAYVDGSGLGLYIAKKIIDAHQDAEIFVEKSVLGKGTIFALALKQAE
jgi:signal transduction histidine kinase